MAEESPINLGFPRLGAPILGGSHMDPRQNLDLLVGAKQIAEFLGVVRDDGKPNERIIYHWAEHGYIPTIKVGGTLTARKSKLAAHFEAA